jgi:hypothetical protein
MAYTTPKTWVTGELVTATEMNTYMRDNQTALKSPPSDQYIIDESADYTTTSTSFVDIDATNFALTITTTGGDIEVSFLGTLISSAVSRAYFTLAVDGTAISEGGTDGIAGSAYSTISSRVNYGAIASFHWTIKGLSAGSHTVKMQWKTTTGTLTLYAGAGTTDGDITGHFSIKEA